MMNFKNAASLAFLTLIIPICTSSVHAADGDVVKYGGYGSHDALCGEARAKCRVVFSDEGIKAGSIVVPSARFAGWTAYDKSDRTCNAFGVCYRSVFQQERQEFTIAYLDEQRNKSKLLISFVNAKAALSFKQELESFTQLAQATKGQAPVKYLSPEEAAKDPLTASAPRLKGPISFNAWVEAPSTTTADGQTIKRFWAPSLAMVVRQNVFEVPIFQQYPAGSTQTGIIRFDCRSGIATSQVLEAHGIDDLRPQGWSVPFSITPDLIAFTAAKALCK